MATSDDSTKNFFPTMQRSIKKSSRITKRKTARKNPIHTHFRFGKTFSFNYEQFPCFSLLGGNRKDPLNLNGLIEKKKQLTETTSSSTSNDNGNDRPVEILLQPDIFDPLRLDTSSRNDEDLNNLYSIPSNSTTEQNANNPMIYPIVMENNEEILNHHDMEIFKVIMVIVNQLMINVFNILNMIGFIINKY
jgi:hypothetical protein